MSRPDYASLSLKGVVWKELKFSMEFIDTFYNGDIFNHIFKISETNFEPHDQGRDCFGQEGNTDKSYNMDKFFWDYIYIGFSKKEVFNKYLLNKIN